MKTQKRKENLKRISSLIVVLALILTMLPATVFAGNNITIVANGNSVKNAGAFIDNGVTYVPLRAISEGLNFTVEWLPNGNMMFKYHTGTDGVVYDETCPIICIGNDDIILSMYIGKDYYNLLPWKEPDPITGKYQIKNDCYHKWTFPELKIIGGTTYVPLRTVGELLECEVSWDQATMTAYISSDATNYYGKMVEKNKAEADKKAAEEAAAKEAEAQASAAAKAERIAKVNNLRVGDKCFLMAYFIKVNCTVTDVKENMLKVRADNCTDLLGVPVNPDNMDTLTKMEFNRLTNGIGNTITVDKADVHVN